MPLFKEFDFEKRYNMIKKDNILFIKVLFKDINNWDNILSNILKKDITIYPANLTSMKETNDLYLKFKEKYKVPKKYIEDFLMKDKEFKIYNTEKEQNEYINYWLNKSSL
jgi:hypothetical protein